MKALPEPLGQVRRWVRTAEDDLVAAVSLMSMGKGCPFSVVAFHSQQCAEKYIKAVLTARSVDFPKTHDLLGLLNILPSRTDLRTRPADIGFLGRFAVEARYPGDHEPVRAADARRAIRIARDVRRAARKLLPRAAVRKDDGEEE